MRFSVRLFISGVAVLAVLLGAEVRGEYIITDLGAGNALAINGSGQVVGWANGAGNTTYGFLYSNGTMTNLSPGSVSGGAQGINASGQVVGWYSNNGTSAPGGSLSTQPFLYSNGVETILGTFPAGSNTYPLSINGSGQVVGYTYQPGITAEQPFLIQNGTTTIFGLSGALQMINANGQAVGGQYLSNTVWQAILYSNGTLTPLGTLGGSNSWAAAINNAGQIAGDSYIASGADHAYLYNNGSMQDLGTLGGSSSAAYGINSARQIVGDAYTASGADHAFIFSSGTMTDLNTLIDPSSGWNLERANAINDNGQIVGYGINASGETDAFLLTPVPVPSTLVLSSIMFGMFGVVWSYKRFKGTAAA